MSIHSPLSSLKPSRRRVRMATRRHRPLSTARRPFFELLEERRLLAAAGELDPTFDTDGKVLTDIIGGDSAFDVTAYQSDGKFVVVGTSSSGRDFAVVRYNEDGSLDTTFGDGGIAIIDFGSSNEDAHSVVIDSSGRVLVGGNSYQGGSTGYLFAVARLTSGGMLDTSFDGDGKQTIDFGDPYDNRHSVAVDSSDRVLVGGTSFQQGSSTGIDFAVARLTNGGALDTSFDGDGKQTIDFGSFSDIGLNVTVDSSDRVLVAGLSYPGGSTGQDFAVARLTSGGALDTSFDGDGKQTIDFGSSSDSGLSVTVDSSDRVLVGGISDQGGATGRDFAVARLTSNGTLDTSFDGDGKQTIDFGSPHDFGRDVAVDSFNRVLVGGNSVQVGSTGHDFDFAVARLTSGGALDTSFAGDGKQTIDFGSPTDQGHGVAVDSFNRVLVAGGSSQGGSTGSDFAVARLTSGGATVTVNEGTTVESTGTFDDAILGDNVTISADIGTITQDPGNSRNWVWELPTTDDVATTTVTITADDGNGGVATRTFDYTVNNVAPHDVEIAASVGELVFAVGSTGTFAGNFKDVSTADTHANVGTYWTFTHVDEAGTLVTENRAATVTQGSGSGTVSDDLSFTAAGVYQATLTVTDDDGGVTTSANSIFVVYDPSAGFVTGGGWILSPEGADRDNPTLTGKASYGFISKYERGASTPTGQTEFQFKAGDLNFHSGSYEWLVVAGARAQYKGEGTINGEGDYRFMLTAIDGQVNGGGGVDKFRIRIWDQASGGLRYDNQNPSDTNDNATPSTAVSGGQIIIHSGGNNQTLSASSTSTTSMRYTLSQHELEDAVGQAITHWASEGVAADQLARLSQVDVQLADLSGSTLGLASNSTNAIWVDVDAAGYGWSLSSNTLQSGGVDLFSTLTHELGHRLGLDHDVLGATLDVGVRSVPNLYTSTLQVGLQQNVFDSWSSASPLLSFRVGLTSRNSSAVDAVLSSDRPFESLAQELGAGTKVASALDQTGPKGDNADSQTDSKFDEGSLEGERIDDELLSRLTQDRGRG